MRTKITKTVGAGVPGGIAAAGTACTLAIFPPLAPLVGLGLYLSSKKDIKDKATEHGSDEAAQQVLDEWLSTRKIGESRATVSIEKSYGTVRYDVKAEDFEDHDLARARTLVELVALLNNARWNKWDDIERQIRRMLGQTTDIVDVAQAYQNLSANFASSLEHNFHMTIVQMANRETSKTRLRKALNCLGYCKFDTRDHINRVIDNLR